MEKRCRRKDLNYERRIGVFYFFFWSFNNGGGGESEEGIELVIKYFDWLISFLVRFVIFFFFLLDLFYVEC